MKPFTNTTNTLHDKLNKKQSLTLCQSSLLVHVCLLLWFCRASSLINKQTSYSASFANPAGSAGCFGWYTSQPNQPNLPNQPNQPNQSNTSTIGPCRLQMQTTQPTHYILTHMTGNALFGCAVAIGCAVAQLFWQFNDCPAQRALQGQVVVLHNRRDAAVKRH